jgi:hypothetical protein
MTRIRKRVTVAPSTVTKVSTKEVSTKGRKRAVEARPRTTRVTVSAVHPEVWVTALRLADGDPRRITVVSSTEAILRITSRLVSCWIPARWRSDPVDREAEQHLATWASKQVCPRCANVGLGLTWKYIPKSPGTYSLAGHQLKVSASRVPVLTCDSCGARGEGKWK